MNDVDQETEGGWRRNPVVAAVAALAALLALSNVVCRVACRDRGKQAATDDSVTMLCPHCGTAYEVSRQDVSVEPDVVADVLQERAASAPCPKCGKRDSVVALTCPKCRKPFAPPKPQTAAEGLKCPHCGADLWGR